jgi:hypothetical protein
MPADRLPSRRRRRSAFDADDSGRTIFRRIAAIRIRLIERGFTLWKTAVFRSGSRGGYLCNLGLVSKVGLVHHELRAGGRFTPRSTLLTLANDRIGKQRKIREE